MWTKDSVLGLRKRRRESQEEFAKRLGVTRPTVSDWENGKVEISTVNAGELDRLARETELGEAPTPDVLTQAILATGENVKRLAEIRGYAQFVLDQLLDLASRQRQVVDALNPWAEAEGRQIALNMEEAAAAEAALRRAVPPIGAPAEPAAPKATRKASGGK